MTLLLSRKEGQKVVVVSMRVVKGRTNENITHHSIDKANHFVD
jgi:hypothetical protein